MQTELQRGLRSLRASVTLLTRIPVGGFPYTDDELRRAAAFLPVVGTALGLLLVLSWHAVGRAGPWVCAVVTVGVSSALTGALHEDGLADTADALGGGHSRDTVLSILKDSRIGTFGAVALIVTLLLRVALLARLEAHVITVLVFSQAASRCVPVGLIAFLPSAQDPQRSKTAPIQSASVEHLAAAVLYTIALTALIAAFGSLGLGTLVLALITAALVGVGLALLFHRRVGGVTGDFLGATQQASEVALLLVIAIVLGP